MNVTKNAPRAGRAARYAVVKALHKLTGEAPERLCRRFGYDERVLRLFTTPTTRANEIPSLGTGSGQYGAETAAVDDGLVEFAEAVKVHSALFKIGPTEAPLATNLSSVLTLPVASRVPEGRAIPVQNATFLTPFELERFNIDAIIVLTRTYLELIGVGPGIRLFEKLLLQAAALAVDTLAFSTGTGGLLNGVSTIASGSATPDGIARDLDEALVALTGADASTVSVVLHPRTAARIGLLRNQLEGRAFSDLNAQGGAISGIPAHTSSGVAETTLVVVDGAACFAGAEKVRIQPSQSTSLEMSSAPTMNAASLPPVATQTVSMFTTECVAMRLIAPTGFKMRRANAITAITGLNLGDASETA